tara:strand:- start:484 stop:591 length:108 start_codon:yes stop_codon:yes gene_type:complete
MEVIHQLIAAKTATVVQVAVLAWILVENTFRPVQK